MGSMTLLENDLTLGFYWIDRAFMTIIVCKAC